MAYDRYFIIKVHPHAAGARGDSQDMCGQKGAQYEDTSGTVADCSMAGKLIEGIDASYLLADKGYDTDTVIEEAGMEAVIPRRKIEKFNENMT